VAKRVNPLEKQVKLLAKQVGELTKLITVVAENQASDIKQSVSETQKAPVVAQNIPSPKKPTWTVPDRKEQTSKGSRIELWSYDEYGQGSIVVSHTDPEEIGKRAKKYVSELNVENALSLDEKDKAWEAYFPVIMEDGKPKDTALYAGNKRDGKHRFYERSVDGTWILTTLDPKTDIRFFLGEINRGRGNKKDWYLADQWGREVKNLSDPLLERKTVLFVKIN
jgi:hypothetical protein